MKKCPECLGNIHKNYCVCPRCGWLEPEARKRDKESKVQIEKQNSKKSYRVKIKTARMDWGKLCDSRVLPER